MNEIMPEDSDFWVEFSLDVVNEQAEDYFALKDSTGTKLAGETSWDENRLNFIPDEELTPGIRYTISVNGKIDTEDGRSFSVSEILPFYYINDNPPVTLDSYSPSYDNPVESDAALDFTLSTAINEDSFLDNFSIYPDIEYTHELEEGASTIRILPEDEWTNLEEYTWSLKRDYENAEGNFLAQDYSDKFVIMMDIEPPELLQVSAVYNITYGTPVTYTQRTAPPAGSALNALQYTDGVFLRFSESIDFELVKTSVTFTPSIAGSWFPVSQTEYIFEPTTGWTMAEEYEMVIKDTLTDQYGNVFYMVDPEAFTPDIPEITVASIRIGTSTPFVPTEDNANYPTDFTIDGDNRRLFSVTFSQPFNTAQERDYAKDALSFVYYYGTTENPSISNISWLNGNTTMEVLWADFPTYSSTKDYYYEFSISEGMNGLHLDNGAFLEEELVIFLHMVD